jgi:DNA repair protein RecN (Recombination protein N)
VGGATAAAVGERLARLSKAMQVLVVTHSPQVAAKGAHHWQVSKGDDGKGGTATRVVELVASGRREEIARMLAGAKVTDQARAAADSLLAAAG